MAYGYNHIFSTTYYRVKKVNLVFTMLHTREVYIFQFIIVLFTVVLHTVQNLIKGSFKYYASTIFGSLDSPLLKKKIIHDGFLIPSYLLPSKHTFSMQKYSRVNGFLFKMLYEGYSLYTNN